MMNRICDGTGSCRFQQQYSWPLNYQAQPQPMGCICPPTSEQTCEAPTCPRKNPLKEAQKRASQMHAAMQSSNGGGGQ